MDKTQKAAEIIQNQGIDGANEAAWLIGTEATISLLMTFLKGNEGEKERQLKEAGLTETAYICPETGYGTLYPRDRHENTELRCIEVTEGECDFYYYGSHPPSHWPDLNHGFRWGKPENSLHQLFAGKYPFNSLRKVLLREHTKWTELYGEEAVKEARSLI